MLIHLFYIRCLRWHLTERWPPVTDEVVKMDTCLLPLTYLCWQPRQQQVAPLFLICLSPMVMSAGHSESNIHAQADLLVLFVWKNRPRIALAAASSRYGGKTLCFKFLPDRTRAMNKAAYLSYIDPLLSFPKDLIPLCSFSTDVTHLFPFSQFICM